MKKTSVLHVVFGVWATVGFAYLSGAPVLTYIWGFVAGALVTSYYFEYCRHG